MSEDYTGPLPDNWTGGQALTKWWRGKLVHLFTLKKPCAQCGAEMRIDVTKAAIEGAAKNAGLHLKRCPKCRADTKALGASSRPTVEGQQPVRERREYVQHQPDVIEETELVLLRTANATMKQELEALYAATNDLRARLEKYELAPAMKAVANGAAKQSGQRMPWES